VSIVTIYSALRRPSEMHLLLPLDMPEPLTRITRDPEVMGGKPCVRGLRVTVGTIVGLVATGRSAADILALYPYLEEDDIREALAYAAWRVEEVEIPLRRPA
jgi:uncharacterized protein (DUF433 family)